MIPFYFTGSILIMLIIWAGYVLIYSGIIRKMGAEPGFGLVPLAAEWRMSKVLFASMRSFYQPVLSSIVFLAASRYVGAQFPARAVAQDRAVPLKRHGFPVFGGGVPGAGICRRPVVDQGEYAQTRCGISDQRQQ